MKSVRVNVANMKPGDVFRGFSKIEGQVVVERAVRNMGKPAKRAYRQRNKKFVDKAGNSYAVPEPIAVDHIMEQLGYINP